MNRTVIVVILKVLGGLIGLLGLIALCMGATLLGEAAGESSVGSVAFSALIFSALICALGAYFVFVYYLAWFRFSSRAIRHICGTIAFWILSIITRPFSADQTWGGVIFLVCGILVFAGYRSAYRRLTRWLFPEDIPIGVPQGASG